MFRKTLVSACLVLGLTTASFGQVKLERKYREGTTQTTETTMRFEQKLTIAGMDTETSSETRSTTKSTIGKRDVAGLLRVQEKVESLQINIGVMGMDYFFDSANPDNKGSSQLEILRDIHKALAQRTTTTIFDKENKILGFEADQDLLSVVPDAVKPLVKSQLDPENLKKAANEELKKLPTEVVNKGDTWQRTESTNFGAGQVMTFQIKYTYEGAVEKDGRTLDKITAKVLTVDFSLQDSPLPFTLKGSDLKAAESDSVLWFDRELGGVVEASASTRITGDITFVINNMDLPSKLDLKIQSGAVLKRDASAKK